MCHSYYQRQSDDTIIQVGVLLWDSKTKKDLLEKGYSKTFPTIGDKKEG